MRELRVAVIGGGFMAKAHSLAYGVADIADDLGVRVIRQVLVDVDADLAADTARRLGWAESSTSWEEVVARDDIDIIDICTPPHLHGPIALAALAAGKHVFCEKPITNDADEAKALVEAARASDAVAQVGFNYRHTPAVTFTKKLLDEGRLGEPLQFRASFLQAASFNADPNRWRARKSTGGSGTVGDVGSHILDIGEYFFGDIVRVAARVRSKSPVMEDGWVPDETRIADDLVDNAGVWIAEFANGALGSFAVNSYAPGRQNRLLFEMDASKGAVEFNWNLREEFRVAYVDEPSDHRGFRTIHTNTEHPNGWWKLAGLGIGYSDVTAIQFQEFFRAIVEGRPATPDFAVGARIQTIIEAVQEAAASGSWVEVPRREVQSR